ncbi:MAG: HlyD family efflux transporter periplasmic adaptor subunit [Anaerolineae bacterium]|nr:HlyD family efflux transporter periplasmic adaptor subunit [Anaerolineae bacterium]
MTNEKGKTIKWIGVIGAVVLTAVLLAGCADGGPETAGGVPMGEGSTPAPTLPPLASAGRTVVADGELASPYPSLALGFGGGVSGRVASIAVHPGDTVTAGDLLAVLDQTEPQRTLGDAERALARAVEDRARAQRQWEQDVANAEQTLADAELALTTARLHYSTTTVEEATTALERARQAESDAEQDYNNALAWYPNFADPYYDNWQSAIRQRELAEMRLTDAQDSNSASYLEVEARQGDVAQAERALNALQEGVAPSYERAVEDAERQVADAQEALAHAQLVAPWAAIVLSVDVAPAAAVSGGTPVVTLLSIEEGLRFVTQNLSEQHVADIRPGQRAEITLRTFASTVLEGEVEAVVPQTGGASADARFAVHIRLAPTDLPLLPGLTGRVEIFTEE